MIAVVYLASIYGFIKGFNDKHKIVDALLPKCIILYLLNTSFHVKGVELKISPKGIPLVI